MCPVARSNIACLIVLNINCAARELLTDILKGRSGRLENPHGRSRAEHAVGARCDGELAVTNEDGTAHHLNRCLAVADGERSRLQNDGAGVDLENADRAVVGIEEIHKEACTGRCHEAPIEILHLDVVETRRCRADENAVDALGRAGPVDQEPLKGDAAGALVKADVRAVIGSGDGCVRAHKPAVCGKSCVPCTRSTRSWLVGSQIREHLGLSACWD